MRVSGFIHVAVNYNQSSILSKPISFQPPSSGRPFVDCKYSVLLFFSLF